MVSDYSSVPSSPSNQSLFTGSSDHLKYSVQAGGKEIASAEFRRGNALVGGKLVFQREGGPIQNRIVTWIKMAALTVATPFMRTLQTVALLCQGKIKAAAKTFVGGFAATAVAFASVFGGAIIAPNTMRNCYARIENWINDETWGPELASLADRLKDDFWSGKYHAAPCMQPVLHSSQEDNPHYNAIVTAIAIRRKGLQDKLQVKRAPSSNPGKIELRNLQGDTVWIDPDIDKAPFLKQGYIELPEARVAGQVEVRDSKESERDSKEFEDDSVINMLGAIAAETDPITCIICCNAFCQGLGLCCEGLAECLNACS